VPISPRYSPFRFVLSLFVLGLTSAYAGVITFEDLPDAYFFNGGGQNIGTFYAGLTFGPNVTGLSVSRFGGYSDAAFPPHSGDVVIWDATDSTITIDFASSIQSFGIWYTSFDPLTLQAFDQEANLLGSAVGVPNTDGTTGLSSFLAFSDPAISSVTLTSTPGLFTLDDLTFGSGSSAVPEPGNLILLTPLLLMLAFYHRCCRLQSSFTQRCALPVHGALVRSAHRRPWSRLCLGGRFLAVVCLGLASLFGQTDTPPVLVAMSISPASVNVTGGSQAVTVSLTLTNNLSGVNFNAVPFRYNEFTIQSPSGRQAISVTNTGTSFALTSGTALNGIWRATLTIPEFSEAGLWTVTALNVFDNAENELSLTTAQLAAGGFPTSLTVISTPDVTPPTLLGLSFSPPSVNTTSSAQPVTLTLNLADSPAGVVFPGGSQLTFDCEIVSPSGKQQQWLTTDEFRLVSGTPQAGSWAGIFTMPQYSEPGTWTIQQLLLQDAANNSENLTAAAITALGFSPTFTVSDSSPDLTPPVLTYFNLAPQVLDTSIGPQIVVATLRATDSPAGVSFAPTTADFTFFYGPYVVNPTNTLTLYTFCNQAAGTPQNGTWQCNITMPAFSAAGAWTVSAVRLKDADDNTVTYTTAQLQALGFPTVITVEPLTSGAVFFGGAGGSTNPTVFVAEPVNSATGNYFSSHVDLAVRGRGLSFQFTRYYNSLDPYSGPLGPGWNHTYNILLATNSANGEVTIRQSDGSTILFTPTGGGNYTAATIGLFDTLKQNGDGSFTLTRKNQVKLTFSPSGQFTTITDRNGNAQTLTYSGGNLLTVTDTVGRTYEFSYDSNNHLVSLVDPSGRTVHYAYNGSGGLISCQDALGGITQYTYDGSNHLLSGTDPRGVVYVQNTYDSSGRVASQNNGRGFATTFAYNTPSANTTTVADPLGNVTQYTYNSSLQIVQIKNAQGGTISYASDANNDKTAITDANGKTTHFTYDGSGNVTSVTDALANTASFTYNSANYILTTKNPVGAVTTFGYDANGDLITITDALGNKATSSYDQFGELVTRTNALNNTSMLTYNGGNVTQIVNALGNTLKFGYDSISRLTTVTDGNGNIFTVTYDSLGRRIKTSDALGNQTQHVYDPVGNLVKLVDADGNPTAYQYDGTNNLVTVTDALGNSTTYGYDANNNRTSFKNAAGNATTYSFDSLNRRVKTTDPLGLFMLYGYDAVGNVVSITDGNKKLSTFGYDAVDRIRSRTYADGNMVSYSYDVNGRRTSMTDVHGTSSYSYDALGRVTSVTSPGRNVVRYGYDAVGHRNSLTYPNGRIVTYAYDTAGRMVQITDWLNRKTTYTFDSAGNRIGMTMGNGANSAFTYDNANRLLTIVNRAGTKPVTSFTYSLDPNGNRSQVTDISGGITRYGYDALNQLTSWTAPSGQVTSYGFDAVGNRTSMNSSSGLTTYAYDADDQMLTAGPSSFTYDGNGNRLTKTTGSATLSYTFDALNRLASVSGGGVGALYQYDGDGNRVSQQAGSSTYQYSLDVARRNAAVLNETGADGNIDFQYGRTLLSGSSSTIEQFYQSDGMGSTADVTDATDILKASYTYDPWGKLLSPIDALGTKDKFKFTGEALDPQTGLYYLRARYYDPSVGRFISRDPRSGLAGLPITAQRYPYARNNPLRYERTGTVVP
jgi:RHS repeat-associated protein